MKIIIIPLLAISLSFISQFKELGNYQNLTSLTIVNPAFSGKKTSISIILNTLYFGNSQLYSASLNNFLDGFNISHYNHSYGNSNFRNKKSTSLQYARLIRISRKHSFRIGASLAQNTFPISSYVNNVYVLTNTTQLSTRIGGLFESKNVYIGVSGLNIPLSEKKYYYNNLLSIHSGIKLNLKENIFTPSFLLLKSIQEHSLLFNLKAKRKWLALNIGYKDGNDLLFGVGVELRRLSFDYIYSRAFSRLSIGTNEHQFQITYNWRTSCKEDINSSFY